MAVRCKRCGFNDTSGTGVCSRCGAQLPKMAAPQQQRAPQRAPQKPVSPQAARAAQGNKQPNVTPSRPVGATGYAPKQQTVKPSLASKALINSVEDYGEGDIYSFGKWLLLLVKLWVPVWNIITVVKLIKGRQENPVKFSFVLAYLIYLGSALLLSAIVTLIIVLV